MEAFAALASRAAGCVRLPVWRRLPADLETPVGAFLRLSRGEDHAFLLESVERGERLGRWTFLGVRPSSVLEARGTDLTLISDEATRTWTGDALHAIQELLASRPSPEVAELPPFSAGAVGFLAYDAVRQMERLPAGAVDELHVPDAVMMFFDELVAFDHVRHEMVLITHAELTSRTREALEAGFAAAQERLNALQARLCADLDRPRYCAPVSATQTAKMQPRSSRAEYIRAVERAKEYIAAGDCFQVVLSQRFDLELEIDPFEIYRALRALNPSPYLFFLRMGDRCLLGSSPEMLTRIHGRTMEYRPIAGTRPRSGDKEEDDRRAEEMRADPKEVAEHVMLVDLGRNDVGRVSEYGSVRVREMMTVERYSHVMHLVSSIEGRLRPEVTATDALRACFPAGTLSGAPKVRAMQIIDELEPVRRGTYGGAVLYADGHGNLDSCIAIRSMYLENGRGYVQAGAGIVADSVPESEYQECLNKAGAVLRAIEIAKSRA